MKKRAFGKLYKELFYIPKHEKLPDKVFRCRMVLSLLTILACAVVMAASTFALFYSEVSTDTSTIASAYYSVTVDSAENGIYICPLAFEDKYTFEIKADGTATTGYCKILVGENVYYTEQILQGESLILTVQAAEGTPIMFLPQWGDLSDCSNKVSFGSEIFHSETNYTVYTVEPTARLSSIAAHYGVSEDDILIYNNLFAATVAEESTTPLLAVGMELKIPNPAEDATPYKVPYATYVVEPTATLDAISAHYGISIEDIVAFNDTEAFGVGASLKIPYADLSLPDYSVPYATYIVEPTATLADIAEHYNLSETDILTYNQITEISVNMPLNIPGVDENTYAVPYATYTIEATATLKGISDHYGISVADIELFNSSVEMIEGNVLNIPGVSPDTPPYVAPTSKPQENENTKDVTEQKSDKNDAPTTDAPTTDTPTTDAPATDAPTTDAPTTDAPTTDAPTTDAPTTDAPTTDAPTMDAPTTDAPATDAPTTDAPATDAPATDAPTTDAPTTDAPAADAPTTDAPATDAPTTDAPTTDAPATDAPTTDAPTTEGSGSEGDAMQNEQAAEE